MPSTVFVLGAGFSMNKGLPSQAAFADALLSERFNSNHDKCITVIIRKFLEDVFDISTPDKYPSLEDAFTFIDLSAGTGHNLGREYSPKKLRAIRRMLIHRVFKILDDDYDVKNPLCIHNFFDSIPNLAQNSANYCFVILNWDIVLENELLSYPITSPIDYCCDGMNLDPYYAPNTPPLRLCKMHGSSNWVYCDNCRNLYFKLNEKQALTAGADINRSDFIPFKSLLEMNNLEFTQSDYDNIPKQNCTCGNPLSYHIATFSYRKSFRNPAYSMIWSRAEKYLSHAQNWVFIGYSLPDADFELKHLLKTAQLQNQTQKHIMIIDKGPDAELKYQRIFGREIKYFGKTLDDSIALKALNKMLMISTDKRN